MFNVFPRWRHRKIPWCKPNSDLVFWCQSSTVWPLTVCSLAIDHTIYIDFVSTRTQGKKSCLNPVHKYIVTFTWRNPSGWPAQPGLNLEEPIRVASPHRIDLEEPVRVASPHRINLEKPVRVASTTRINSFTWRNLSGWPAQPG